MRQDRKPGGRRIRVEPSARKVCGEIGGSGGRQPWYRCPACRSDVLHRPPWDPHGRPSHEACPACGIEFGSDDSSAESREQRYRDWRDRWERAGRVPLVRPGAGVPPDPDESGIQRVYACVMEGGHERWRLIEAEPLGNGRYRVLGLAGSRGAPGAGASRGGAPVEGVPRDEATSAVDSGSAEGTVIRCERRWLTGGGSRLVAVELLSADGSLVPGGGGSTR